MRYDTLTLETHLERGRGPLRSMQMIATFSPNMLNKQVLDEDYGVEDDDDDYKGLFSDTLFKLKSSNLVIHML